MAIFTPFDASTQSGAALAAALLGNSSVTILPGTARVSSGRGFDPDPQGGAAQSFVAPIAYYDGSVAALGIGAGVHLSSGNASAYAHATGASALHASVVLDNTAATQDVVSSAALHLGFPVTLRDATVLEFQFNVGNPTLGAISFDLVFATHESASWDRREFSDFAAVYVNGTNYGVSGARNDRPMSALAFAAENGGNDVADPPGPAVPGLSYALVTGRFTVTAPVTPGANTMKIVIADTGDALGDSGLFVANLRALATAGPAPAGAGIAALGPSAGAIANAPTIGGTAGDDLLTGSDKVVSESLVGLGGDDTITGGPGDDTLFGGDGADSLDYPTTLAPLPAVYENLPGSAHAGLDLLIGGPGDDVYFVQPGDRIVEQPGEGEDWVVSLGRFSLIDQPSLEDVYLVNTHSGGLPLVSPLGATGNGASNYLVGSEGANYLVGEAGDDALLGAGGGDVLVGGAGDDALDGGAGDDFLFGGAGNDTLDGGDGVDTAVFSEPIERYRLERIGVNWEITSKSAAGDSDLIFPSVERAIFGDASYALTNPPQVGLPGLGASRDFLFDSVFYMFTNPDLVPTLDVAQASQHYLSTGAFQGRDPNSWFDPAYYANKWADLGSGQFDNAVLFMHYNLYGVWEGRSAGPAFDRFAGDRYLSENPDVGVFVDANLPTFLGSRTNGAIAHFMIYGAAEQRVAYDLIGQQIDLGYLIDFA